MPLARLTRSVLAAALVCLAVPVAARADDYGFTNAPGSPFATEVDALDVVIADIDADSSPDVVMGDWFGNTIEVYWGTSGGSFDPTPTRLSGSSDHIVVARLDGDADLDIAAAGVNLQAFFKNNGLRTFTAGPAQPVDTGDDFEPANGMVAADFDGDADNDIALTVFVASSSGPTGGALRIYENDPTGTFAHDHNEVSEDGDYFGDLVVGNFNADTDPDLAYISVQAGVFFGEPFIGLLLGGTGVDFTPGTNIQVPSAGAIATADLDGDTELDLVTEGSVNVHWGIGDGTFDPAQEVDSDFASGFFFGDFNDDGLLDIGLDGDPVLLLTNRGSRTFARGGQFAGSEYGLRGAAADLDDDPRDDLVLGGFFEMFALITGDPPPPPPPDDDGDGGGGTTTPPPGDTTPPPGGTTPPMTIPPGGGPGQVTPVTATQLATLPSAGKRPCGSRRNFRIRLRRPPAGVTVTEARVLVNGKRVKVVRGRRLTAPVDLRGFPRGRAVVTIRITLADGRVLRGRRVYRPCATKKRKGRFGRRRRG